MILRSDFVPKEEKGFTLIELMVVVMVIAILIAIAVPTFLGARGRAQDKAARANMKIALSALIDVAHDSPVFTVPNTAKMQAAEPSLTWQSPYYAQPTGPKTISYYAWYSPTYAHVTYILVGTLSDSGRCQHIYYLEDINRTGSSRVQYQTYDPPCGYYGRPDNQPVAHGGNLVSRIGDWPA